MRFSQLVAFMVFIFTVVAQGAFAAPLPERAGSIDLRGVRRQQHFLPGTDALQTVCRVGQFGDPVGTIGDETTGGTVFYGEGDTYWTFLELRPDSCPGCGAGKRGVLTTAHIALFFPFAPETVTVRVSVVGSVPVTCHYPNYLDPGAILCAPFTATFDNQDALVVTDVAIPIPPGCQLVTAPQGDGVGFLGFEFVSASDTTTFHKPLLSVQAAARVCTSWNPIGDIPFDMVPTYLIGNPVMYADVAQCYSAVDVAPREPAIGALRLGAATPNPSFGRVSFMLSQARAGELDVAVYDVLGAKLRSLASGSSPVGEHRLEWDGRDRFGRTAPAGVYYVRALSGPSSAVQRVLRMR